MQTFTIFNEKTAPQASRALLKSGLGKYGFIPNLWGELAASPQALDAYVTLTAIFEETGLTRAEQQVVLLTTSFANGCSYCMAAHSTVASMVGLEAETLTAIREGREIESDPRLEALRRFTQSVVTDRGLVDADAVDAFLKAGFTKANILDVITGVSLKTLSNYTNHIAETPVDTAFEPMAWRNPLLQPAE